MSNAASKGLKPFAIKAVIVIMSVLYVLGPIHLEMTEFLHTIVHSLEMPDTIISHKKGIEATNYHQSSKHKKAITLHDHGVIELVEKILKGADDGIQSPDSLPKIQKIDKHISVRKVLDQDKDQFLVLLAHQSFSEIDGKLCTGYSHCFEEPPQV